MQKLVFKKTYINCEILYQLNVETEEWVMGIDCRWRYDHNNQNFCF